MRTNSIVRLILLLLVLIDDRPHLGKKMFVPDCLVQTKYIFKRKEIMSSFMIIYTILLASVQNTPTKKEKCSRIQ